MLREVNVYVRHNQTRPFARTTLTMWITVVYGTPERTFPFQYLAENKLDSMLFKWYLYVEKKGHNDIISR